MTIISDRRTRILEAIDAKNWSELRGLSLEPRGFESARQEAWLFMLGVRRSPGDNVHPGPETPKPPQPEKEKDDFVAHSDERQVHLDTERSFVLYPPLSPIQKERRKAQLESLIVALLRKRSALNYFQGYHDIVTVILLTFQPDSETTLPTDIHEMVEKLSLHRLRDSMGVGLAPLIGQLRILRRLLRLEDPDFALLLESASPLPYFALSNLLTLFAHDIPTLSLCRHVFDYLLARPPVYAIYLAAAIILSRISDVQKLESEGDDGMIHALLTRLPDIVDEEEEDQRDSIPPSPTSLSSPSASDIPAPKYSETDPIMSGVKSVQPSMRFAHPDDTLIDDASTSEENTLVVESSPPEATSNDSTVPSAGYPTQEPEGESRKAGSIPLATLLRAADDLYERFPPWDTAPPDVTSAPEALADADPMDSDSSEKTTSPTFSTASLLSIPRPSLDIGSVFGPTSVLFTWSEDPAQLLPDDAAEQLVADGLQGVCEVYDGASDRDLHEGEPPSKEKDGVESEDERHTREERRKELIRSGVGLGVALLVGLSAVVLYSVDRSLAGNDSGRDSRSLQQWYQTSTWAAGFVIGLGERVLNVL